METPVSNVPVFTDSYGTQVGRVKWFRSKLGYGFITTWDNEKSQEVDVFVHQSHIKTQHSQYRTLKEGEYVSLNVSVGDDSQQAVDVTGVHGGPLMCDNQHARQSHNDQHEDDHHTSEVVAHE
jgi:cold shock CspA family protein|tara:strand:+ start:2106 stop:2474 length:369 start_codon:yes stop_codon:yes gene_type:complete